MLDTNLNTPFGKHCNVIALYKNYLIEKSEKIEHFQAQKTEANSTNVNGSLAQFRSDQRDIV